MTSSSQKSRSAKRKARPTKKRSSSDIFGSYLEKMHGNTAIEQVLDLVRKHPHTIGDLARTLDFTPEDIASAVGNASSRGLVQLEEKDDETVVSPASSSFSSSRFR